ncbi:MAG: MFS transporter [Acidimicrobiales bacterium]
MRPAQTEFSPTDGHPQRWGILAIMCSCLILVVAGVSSLNIAIPSIIDALEPSSTQTLWIVDGYALVFAGLLLPAGAIGDRYGRKGALLSGLAMFVGGALWAAWASDATALILARGSMGVGAAFIMPATLSIIISVFPLRERAKAIGVWAGFAGAGGAIGIVAGGALLENYWWGSVFLINVPIAIAAAVLIAAVVPTSRDENETPLDVVGSLLSIAGLGSLVYAIIEGGEAGWTEGSTIGWFVAAAVFLTGWVLWELRTPNALLDPRLFRRIPFGLGSLTIIAAFAVMFGMFFIITQYFQFVQGHGPLSAGLRNLPFATTMLIVAPFSSTVAGRFGKRYTMVLGLALQVIGFVVMSQLDVETAYGVAALGMVLMAGGMALLMPAASEAIVSSVPPSKAGVGSAWNDSTREIGGALGIAVMGTLLASGYRSSIEDSASGFGEEAAESIEEGIGPTLRIAAEEQSPELAVAAQDAFIDGLSLAFTTAAVVGVVIGLLVLVRYPRRGFEPAAVTEEQAAV